MKKLYFLLILFFTLTVSAQTTVTVNFSVDANGGLYPDATYTNMVLNGTFAPGEEWWGWGVELTDSDMDGIYTGSRVIAANFDYEFIIAGTGAGDAWSGWGVQSGYNGTTCGGAGGNYLFSTVTSDLDISISILPAADGSGFWGGCMTVNSLSTNDYELTRVKAFPNPTENVWNITTNNENIQSITLYDVLGKQVFASKPNSSDVKINSNKLSNGIYFAKVKTINGEMNLRLVKN